MASVEYKQNIYPKAPRTRKTVAEIAYSLTAPDSKEGGLLTLPPGNAISRSWQIMNEIVNMSSALATLEPDYWRLDGTFQIPVMPDEQPEHEYGWWSESMSDADGYFITPPVIEREFEMIQTFNTLGIHFDRASDNYCSEFTVEFYGGFGGLMYREDVTGNESSLYNTQRAGIDVLRVVITLIRTNQPYRYARVTELDFGLTLTYTGKDIIFINAINEADPTGRAYIYPELSVTIINNGLYDLLDPESYAPYFLQRQRFHYNHGLVLPNGEIEWVFCGNYYLSDWTVTDNSVTFKTVGRTYDTDKSMFYESSMLEFSLAQLARRVEPTAVVTVASPPITGYFGNIPRRKALAFLAELSGCLVYEDRNNTVRFVDFTESSELPADTVNYANSDTPSAKTNEYFNAINLTEYEYIINDGQISRTTHKPGIIRIIFSRPLEGEPAYELTQGYLLTDLIWHTTYMTANIFECSATKYSHSKRR